MALQVQTLAQNMSSMCGQNPTVAGQSTRMATGIRTYSLFFSKNISGENRESTCFTAAHEAAHVCVQVMVLLQRKRYHTWEDTENQRDEHE